MMESKKSEKEFVSRYRNKDEYIKEYIKATLYPYIRTIVLCAVVVFALAGVSLSMQMSSTVSILLIILGICLLIDAFFFYIHRAIRKTVRQYKSLYQTPEVEIVSIVNTDGIEFRVQGKSVNYTYDQMRRVEGTEHLIVFIFDNGVVPFLRNSFTY